MKRTLMILIMLAGPLLFAGCPETPFGTVPVEDEQGQKIASAWDKDFDGVADIDPATGEVDLVLPKAAYAVAQQVDEVAPGLLKTAGGLLGISFLTILGLAWKNRKWAGFGISVVESVQAVRQTIATEGPKGFLKIFDAALKKSQSRKTKAIVDDIKLKANVASVDQPVKIENAASKK